MPLEEGNPLWGIVTSEAATKLNLSTMRKMNLCLPGYNSLSLSRSLTSHQNLPGVDVPVAALEVLTRPKVPYQAANPTTPVN